jgi:gluconate 2-dehydrogenase gamma chain
MIEEIQCHHPFISFVMTKLNRRDFIQSASLAFGSILLFPSCLKQNGIYRIFTPEEALCIIAICEQIIPKDESPGATDAGVIYYIDKQLSGVFHYDQETYRNGIKNLQEYCTKKHTKLFENLTFDEQTKLLIMLESNQLNETEWQQGKPSDFFNLVRSHTMQGFYGSPIHGGNKNYMSFEMLKIDYPLVIGQNRYRA